MRTSKIKFERLEVSTRPQETTSVCHRCNGCCSNEICSPFFIISWLFAVGCIASGALYSLLDDNEFLRRTKYIPAILLSILCFHLVMEKYKLAWVILEMREHAERQTDLLLKRNETSRKLFLAKEANTLLKEERARHHEAEKQDRRKRKRLSPKLQALQVKYARIKDRARKSRRRFVIHLKEATELNAVVQYLNAESKDLDDVREGISEFINEGETITEFVSGANIFLDDCRCRKLDVQLRELALRLETRKNSEVGLTRGNFLRWIEQIPLDHWKSRIHFSDYVDGGLLPWSDMSNIIEEILEEIDPPHALEGVYLPDLLRVKSITHNRTYSPFAGKLDINSLVNFPKHSRFRTTDSGSYSHSPYHSPANSWGGGSLEFPGVGELGFPHGSVDSLGKLSFGSSVGRSNRTSKDFTGSSAGSFDYEAAQNHLRMIESLMSDEEVSGKLVVTRSQREHNPFLEYSVSSDRHSIYPPYTATPYSVGSPPYSVGSPPKQSGRHTRGMPSDLSTLTSSNSYRSEVGMFADTPTEREMFAETPTEPICFFGDSPFHIRQNSNPFAQPRRIPSLNTLLDMADMENTMFGKDDRSSTYSNTALPCLRLSPTKTPTLLRLQSDTSGTIIAE